MSDRIEEADRATALDGLSAYIRERSATNGAALAPEDARFYAMLFLLQTALDKLFVPDEDIVIYETTSGAYHVTDRYDHCIRCLALFGRKLATASRAEYDLCYDITTAHGWTKPYYMWADCESPENFDNILEQGIWTSQTIWRVPMIVREAHASDHAWCALQINT